MKLDEKLERRKEGRCSPIFCYPSTFIIGWYMHKLVEEVKKVVW
jgi:hypothetical protein